MQRSPEIVLQVYVCSSSCFTNPLFVSSCGTNCLGAWIDWCLSERAHELGQLIARARLYSAVRFTSLSGNDLSPCLHCAGIVWYLYLIWRGGNPHRTLIGNVDPPLCCRIAMLPAALACTLQQRIVRASCLYRVYLTTTPAFALCMVEAGRSSRLSCHL